MGCGRACAIDSFGVEIDRDGGGGFAETGGVFEPALGKGGGAAEVLAEHDGLVAVHAAEECAHVAWRLHAEFVAREAVEAVAHAGIVAWVSRLGADRGGV